MGSNEPFARSVYFTPAQKSNKPKSPPNASPGAAPTSTTKTTKRASGSKGSREATEEEKKEERTVNPNESTDKTNPEKSANVGKSRERDRQPETTQQATENDNSQMGKYPDGDKKKKKKKTRRARVSVSMEKVDVVTDREDKKMKLREFNFYHGFLPREDLHSTLHNSGDYLIRVSEVVEGETKVNREVILSLIPIQSDGKEDTEKKNCRNVVIKRVGNKCFCEPTRTFESVTDLIKYYTDNSGSCSNGRFQLKNPILQQPWEYMHSDVTAGKVLGEGAFGKVFSGTLKLKDGSSAEVAIKMTKVSAFLSKIKIKEMMNEARFIRNFNHKNVVRLYGVAHDEQPLYILLELVKGGSLQDHMKKAKATGTVVPIAEKVRFCIGAARGIEYLHQNNCIHRDIAARNCLLSEKEVKITDFGLSRNGPSYKIKAACKLPVKWLAPETLSSLCFTFATDVYSWGITCYEVFADGAEPYEGIPNATVKADVLNNKFIQMPPHCPDSIKKYMSTFIFVDASCRASMTMAIGDFERMTVMSETGASDPGTKNKFMKILKKKKKEKESKND